MIFDDKRYECKTFFPNKRDYTEYTFYSIKNKLEVQVMGFDLCPSISFPGVLEVGKKITMNGEDLLFISSCSDIDEFHNHLDGYRREEALLEEVFIKDVLEHNVIEDNKFSRYLVKRLMSIHGGPVFEVWEEMAHYAEIYDFAEEFFSGRSSS